MLQWVITLVCISLTVAQDWQLIWSDEFDGPELDSTKWGYEITAGGGGNAEFQTYIPDTKNTYIQDGKLFIKPTLLEENINPKTGEPFGEEFLRTGVLDLVDLYGDCTDPNGCYRVGGDIPPIASGRINGKFSFRYGRAEILAKMPVGDWLWPALWLLPDDWFYGGWPMSGEIDIVESIGNRNLKCEGLLRGMQHVGSALHWGVDWTQNKYYLTHRGLNNDDFNYGDYFHLYTLDWTPNGIVFSLDGVKIMSIPDPMINERDGSNCFTGFYDFGAPWNGDANPWTNHLTCDQAMAPFDQEYYFIFNVAVGSTEGFFPDDCVNWDGEPGREKPWRNGIGQQQGMWHFYNNRASWEDTWTREGDNLAMQVDWVRVYQPVDGFPRTETPQGCPADPGPNNCPAP